MPLLCGNPRLGPRSSNNWTVAATLICSSSDNPAHQCSNSSVYSHFPFHTVNITSMEYSVKLPTKNTHPGGAVIGWRIGLGFKGHHNCFAALAMTAFRHGLQPRDTRHCEARSDVAVCASVTARRAATWQCMNTWIASLRSQ